MARRAYTGLDTTEIYRQNMGRLSSVGTYASTTPFFSLSLFHGSYLLPAIFLLAYRRLKCSYFYRLSCHFSSYFINLFYYLTCIHFRLFRVFKASLFSYFLPILA